MPCQVVLFKHARRVGPLLTGAVLWSGPNSLRAAPHDGYPLSNDAAMRGGAAIVLGRDAASVWYNPASVAATRRAKFDASASIYGLRLVRVPSSLQATVGDEVRKAEGKDNQVLVVPAATAFAFGWPSKRLAGAFSFHTARYSDTQTRLELSGRNQTGDYHYFQQAAIYESIRQYHLGLTIGWEPVDALRIGATLSGVYDSNAGFVRFVVDAQSKASGASAAYIADTDVTSSLFALEAAIGLQGEFTPWLHAGATVRAPAGVVWSRTQGGETLSVAAEDGMGGSRSDTQEPEVLGDPPRWLTPWTVGAGLALRLKRFDLELDAEAATARLAVERQYQRKAVWNIRLGGTYAITPRWILGAGLFTDRSTRAERDLYPNVVIDRWGTSLGIRLVSPVRLARSERVDHLVFETTVAARYAFGIGRSTPISVTYPDQGPQATLLDLTQETRATEHLLALHVGSGMRF